LSYGAIFECEYNSFFPLSNSSIELITNFCQFINSRNDSNI